MDRGTSQPPVLSAKVAPPILHAPVLHRLRLYEQLQRALRHRLTLITADAGFGKTTLLTGFLQTSPRKVTRYRLDPEDSDPATFLRNLFSAFRRRLRLRTSGDPTLAESWSTASRLLLQTLDRVRGDLVLVFDDYHLLQAMPTLADGMGYFVSCRWCRTRRHEGLFGRSPAPRARRGSRGAGGGVPRVLLSSARQWGVPHPNRPANGARARTPRPNPARSALGVSQTPGRGA